MGELNRLAAGKQLHVNLSVTEKWIVSSNESKHASIGGERRVHHGVREKCELLPIGAGWRCLRMRKMVESDSANEEGEDETRERYGQRDVVVPLRDAGLLDGDSRGTGFEISFHRLRSERNSFAD